MKIGGAVCLYQKSKRSSRKSCIETIRLGLDLLLVRTEDNIMMQKYVANPKLKEYIVKKAYKEKEKWKAGKSKRVILGFGGFALPFAVYSIMLLSNLIGGRTIGNAIVDASPAPLVLMIICWPIAIITLKFQNHNAKLIPEDRKYDEVILTEDQLTYSYSSTADGYMYETIIRYSDISRIQHSVMRRSLFVFGGYNTRITKNGERIKEIRLRRESGQYITIPLYFDNADEMLACLVDHSRVALERIEEN